MCVAGGKTGDAELPKSFEVLMTLPQAHILAWNCYCIWKLCSLTPFIGACN